MTTDDGQKVLDAMQARFVTLQPVDEASMATLCEVDEAMEVMYTNDHKDVIEGKKKAVGKREQFKEYAEEFRFSLACSASRQM